MFDLDPNCLGPRVPNSISIGSAVFAGLTNVKDRQRQNTLLRLQQ